MNNPINSLKNLVSQLRFLVVFTTLLFYTNFVYAQPSFCISSENGTTSVTVDVTVENFNSIVGVQFPITWSPNLLEFDSNPPTT